MILVFILVITALAYWRGDRPLFLLSGLGFVVYGFSYTATSLYYSILMVLVGIFLVIRAFTDKGRV